MDIHEPYCEFLPPEKVALSTDDSNRVRLTIAGDRSYPDIWAVRAFPLSDLKHHIGLLDAKAGNKVIGIIADPTKLERTSRRILAHALDGHYFVPVITAILSMREEFGAVYFEVETDRGTRQFIAKGLRDGVRHLGNGELLIPDVDGNRYRIDDWRRLDTRSQRLIEHLV